MTPADAVCVNKSNSFRPKLLLLLAKRSSALQAWLQFIMTRTRQASNIDEISAAINFHAQPSVGRSPCVCFRCSARRDADDAARPTRIARRRHP